jgi:hypothetical protein
MEFLSSEVKRSGREAIYPPQFSAKFNNMWSYTSMPHMRLGVQWEELRLDFTNFM